MKLLDIINKDKQESQNVPKVFKNKKPQHNMTSSYRKLNNMAISQKQSPINKSLKYNSTILPKVYSTSNNIVYINAWVNYNNNKLIPRNYGDDINFSFLNQIIPGSFQLYKSFYNTKNYLSVNTMNG